MTGPFAFLRRLFVRDEPLTESERDDVRWVLLLVRNGNIITEADLFAEEREPMRLALRYGYATDGNFWTDLYRVTPKGERFLQEFER